MALSSSTRTVLVIEEEKIIGADLQRYMNLHGCICTALLIICYVCLDTVPIPKLVSLNLSLHSSVSFTGSAGRSVLPSLVVLDHIYGE